MGDGDSSYYCRRIEQEQAAAERAADPEISRIHLELVQRYRALLEAGSGALNGRAREEEAEPVPQPGTVFG